MNPFWRWLARRGARADARFGLTSVEERLTAELGLRPRFDPVGNFEHGELARVLADGVEVQELQEDVERAENELTGYVPPPLYTAGLVVAVAIEVVGAILIMRALGVSPTERVPLGLALAFALVGITAVTAHRAAAPKRTEGSLGARAVEAAKRSVWTLVVLAAYSIMVVAVAIVRIRSSTDDDSSQLEVFAHALIMVATSIGPAWIVEWLIRRRSPVAALYKQASVLRRRLRKGIRARESARATVNRLAREGAHWDGKAARRRAEYQVHHRLEGARDREGPTADSGASRPTAQRDPNKPTREGRLLAPSTHGRRKGSNDDNDN